LRVQEYRNDAKKIIWAVWSPTGSGNTLTAMLDHLPGRLVDTQPMPLTARPSPPVAEPLTSAGELKVTVDESPLYLVFENP